MMFAAAPTLSRQPATEGRDHLLVGMVEDNESDRALVQATLRRTTLDMKVVAVARLGDTTGWSDAPACILLDLSLPDADGLEGLNHLAQAMPTVPIVILTGNDDVAMASASLACGAQDYLVKGQFDAHTLERTIRHAIDRKRAQLELDARRALNDAVLNSIDAHTAVLDHQGMIISVNEPWRRFAAENGADPDAVGVGISYLDVCRQAARDGGPDAGSAAEVLAALEDILAGRRTGYTADYPCHAPAEERWFSLRASSLGPAGAVVVHVPITEHKQRALELEAKALHDPLTGLANRALLFDRLTLLLDQRRRGSIAVAFIDLDGFKAANDRHGHQAGDRLLQHVGRRLQSATRAGDIVARLGGDEFVVAGEVDDAEAALALGERLVATVKAEVPGATQPLVVTASVGVAYIAVTEDIDADTAVARADTAMFAAKRRGTGSVAMADTARCWTAQGPGS